MRWLINYIRSCFCKHEWELIFDVKFFEDYIDPILVKQEKVYRCKKRGIEKRYKSQK